MRANIALRWSSSMVVRFCKGTVDTSATCFLDAWELGGAGSIGTGGGAKWPGEPAALLRGNRPLMLGSLVTAQFMSFSGRILSPSKRSQSVDFHTGEMKRYLPPSMLLRPRSDQRTFAQRPVGRSSSAMIHPAATVGLSWSRLWWSKSIRTPGQLGSAVKFLKASTMAEMAMSSRTCTSPVGRCGHSPRVAMLNQPSSGSTNSGMEQDSATAYLYSNLFSARARLFLVLIGRAGVGLVVMRPAGYSIWPVCLL